MSCRVKVLESGWKTRKALYKYRSVYHVHVEQVYCLLFSPSTISMLTFAVQQLYCCIHSYLVIKQSRVTCTQRNNTNHMFASGSITISSVYECLCS